MKNLVWLAAPALLLLSVAYAQDSDVPTSASSSDTRKLDLATEIVNLGFPEAVREDIFFGAMDTMVSQIRDGAMANIPSQDPQAVAILDEWLAEWVATSKAILRGHIPALMAAQATGYAEIFTEEELQDIRAFVGTPSGQRFMQLSPSVMATPAFATANEAYVQEIYAEFPKAQAQLAERMAAYARSVEE